MKPLDTSCTTEARNQLNEMQKLADEYEKKGEGLLPCPLCGRKVELKNFAGYEILCECGMGFALDNHECGSKEKTKKAWNKRI